MLGTSWIDCIHSKHKIYCPLNKSVISKKKNVIAKKVDLFNYRIFENYLKKINPDHIIHTAAFTNVDSCEKQKIKANKINYKLTKNIANLCKKYSIKLIYISTDHLFSGKKKFCKESDKTNPINQYALTKRNGEKEILKSKKNLILRTNFFGKSLNNKVSFSDFVIKNLKNKNFITLFDDVYITPLEINNFIKIAEVLIKKNKSGIYNISSNERISKYNLGLKIAKLLDLDEKYILRGSIENANLFSKRPKDMSLCNKKLRELIDKNKLSINFQLNLIMKTYRKKKQKKIKEIIPYGKHYIDKKDISEVVKTLQSSNLTQGPKIEELEKKICTHVGCKYAVAVSSATAGLHLATLALGIKKGDKIITSPITFVSTASIGYYSGADPVFSDIDPKTVNLSAEILDKTLNSIRNNKFIIPVHFGGLPCDMKRIKKIGDKTNSVIIEDAAHALGSKYSDGSMVGNCKYSDATVFSLHPVKIIAAGEGGIITTNNLITYKKLLKFRSHGIIKEEGLYKSKNAKTGKFINPWYYEIQELGFHYRLTDIQSSLAISQLRKINLFVKKRNLIAKKYDRYFAGHKIIKKAQIINNNELSSYHLYLIRIDFNKLKISRAKFFSQLKKKNILSQVHYIPVPMHYFYEKKGYNMKNLPNSYKYYNETLSLPIYYSLKNSEQKYVVETILEMVRKSE